MNRTTKNFLYYSSLTLLLTCFPLCFASLTVSKAFESGNCDWLPGCEDRQRLEAVFYWLAPGFVLGAAVGFAGVSYLPPPEHAGDFNHRGKRYQSKHQYDEAIANYNTAIKLKPLAEYYNNRGSAYYACGDIQAAIADFDKAIALDPHFPRAYLNKGIVHMDREEKDAAYSSIRKAQELYNSPIPLTIPEHSKGSELSEYLMFVLSLGQDPLKYQNR